MRSHPGLQAVVMAQVEQALDQSGSVWDPEADLKIVRKSSCTVAWLRCNRATGTGKYKVRSLVRDQRMRHGGPIAFSGLYVRNSVLSQESCYLLTTASMTRFDHPYCASIAVFSLILSSNPTNPFPKCFLSSSSAS